MSKKNKKPKSNKKNGVFGIIIFIIVIVLFAALFIIKKTNSTSSSLAAIDGMTCDNSEQFVQHIHSHLTIFSNGEEVPVPANIGIHQEASCIYWLHTHDDTGVIHIEAPNENSFTLGNFFDVWGQKLTTNQVGDYSNGKQIRIYVDGKIYNGDPKKIPLKAHSDIVLEVGPKFVPAPDKYIFQKDE
jgi:hypothetical protein